jgi:hypothetical protein
MILTSPRGLVAGLQWVVGRRGTSAAPTATPVAKRRVVTVSIFSTNHQTASPL